MSRHLISLLLSMLLHGSVVFAGVLLLARESTLAPLLVDLTAIEAERGDAGGPEAVSASPSPPAEQSGASVRPPPAGRAAPSVKRDPVLRSPAAPTSPLDDLVRPMAPPLAPSPVTRAAPEPAPGPSASVTPPPDGLTRDPPVPDAAWSVATRRPRLAPAMLQPRRECRVDPSRAAPASQRDEAMPPVPVVAGRLESPRVGERM